MAEEKSFTLLKVSGYLQVPEKIGRKATKKRWCLFDERTCSLKYYKDQTSCKERGNEPLGEINLASAKLTSFVAEGSSKPSNQFFITTDEGSYQLQAKDNKEALEWIRKLQDKRSEYHKAGYARENQDEAPKVQTIPRTPGPGGLLEGSPESSPIGVRNIMQQILSNSVPAAMCTPANSSMTDQGSSRRSLVEGAPALLGDPTLSCVYSTSGDVDASETDYQRSLSSDEQLQLEYYKSQETSTSYYKEVQKLKQIVESKDAKILALKLEIEELNEKISAMNIPVQVIQLQEEKANLEYTLRQLLESIKVFVNEVDQHKEQAQMNEKKITREKMKNTELEKSINNVKRKYVQVLTESLTRSALSSESCRDNLEITGNPRLLELLEEEGWETEGVFEDEYGDIHDCKSGINVQLFLCRCLYLHYSQHEQEALSAEWEAILKSISKAATSFFTASDKAKQKEFRDLLRKGLPITFRKEVWTILVNRHVAKVKEVKDHTCGGVSYYQSLLNSVQQSTCLKQIDLDLHRTMPSNKFFKRGGLGITQLENVLIAYSVHNKNVGYCQGMNMIAALGLLFLDEEATFWYLVAIIEKILPNGYYGSGLMGAQADQAVMKEVLATQIVDLNEHMSANYIDITLVTFNWFLTLFIDAVPTECSLRIMDVFLNEGHKVLYRVAIGILTIYKDHFLSLTDPVTLLQILKDISRRTYTIEDIFQVAFTRDFPKRSHINGRHSYHMNLFKHEWQERQKETQVHKEVTTTAVTAVVRPPPQQSTKRVTQWVCGCSIRTGNLGDAMCLCSGEKDQGIISVITVGQEPQMKIIPDMVIKGKAVCMTYISSCDMVLIGTLDFYVYAVDCLTWKKLWYLKLIDSVLNMETINNTVFFALAEGSLAIIKNIDQTRPLSEPLLIRIGSSSVPCLALVPNQMLWCGSEKSITVLSTVTCELEKSVVIDDDDDLGKIYKMKCGQQGVWVSFKSSTIICLFDVDRYTKLLQVDYVTLPTLETHDRITSLLPVQGYLWLGTRDGTIHVLSVKARELPQKDVSPKDASDSPKMQEGNIGCGLVTVEEVEEKEEEVEEDEDEDEGAKLKEVKIAVHISAPGKLHRKSRFGTTLRHRKRLVETKKEEKVGPYVLAIETSKHVMKSRKEPVRTIQACQGPDNSTIVVSTVHTEFDKAVQLWRCSDQNATNWDMVYLQCSEK